jgi:hypothetical protein
MHVVFDTCNRHFCDSDGDTGCARRNASRGLNIIDIKNDGLVGGSRLVRLKRPGIEATFLNGSAHFLAISSVIWDSTFSIKSEGSDCRSAAVLMAYTL